jgi:hypothetical protein
MALPTCIDLYFSTTLQIPSCLPLPLTAMRGAATTTLRRRKLHRSSSPFAALPNKQSFPSDIYRRSIAVTFPTTPSRDETDISWSSTASTASSASTVSTASSSPIRTPSPSHSPSPPVPESPLISPDPPSTLEPTQHSSHSGPTTLSDLLASSGPKRKRSITTFKAYPSPCFRHQRPLPSATPRSLLSASRRRPTLMSEGGRWWCCVGSWIWIMHWSDSV